MSEFRFAEPGFVHLLWGVLLFVAALFLLERRGSDTIQRLTGSVLRGRLVHGPASWRRVVRLALLGLAGACLVLALMRPQAGLRQVATPQVGAELMIALDVSRSMLAEDAVPNRLERAKAEIADLLGYLEGDQVGLVAFAGRASVLCPLTPDFGFLRLVLESTGPGSVTRGGSRLAEPIRKALEGFGEPSGASRAILLITDGEDHDSFALDAAKAAAEVGVRIIAIGFGDENGSEIYVTDPRSGARELVRDAAGRPVRTRLDGDLLREIALATDGAYVPAQTGVLDLESIYATHIAGLTRGALDARARTVRDEIYGWFVLAAIVLLVASAGIAAGPSRVAVALLAGLLLTPVPRLHAAEAEADPTAVAQEGVEGEALGIEPETEEVSPATPRERYNAGVAALAKGDLEEAERHLSRAHDEAGDDAELRFRARYDLGFAIAQRARRMEGEQPQAALADLYLAADWFREAVQIRPDDEDARVNLEVSLRLALVLADRLAREREQGLETELGALASRQREIAEEIVRLHAVAAANTSPDAGERLRDEYRAAATSERVLLSDADALAARSGEEQAALEVPDPAELTPEDAVRRAQLEGVLHYLHRARERMGQVRRQLRERQGERAYRRAATALAELERAIDQLRDPVALLDRLLQEQGELTGQTSLLVAEQRGVFGEVTGPRPLWLDRDSSADAQGSLVERVMELGMRLRAGLEAGPPEAEDPQQAALFEAVAEAVPLVESAREALRTAYSALDGGVLDEALPAQQVALEQLAAARERFLDLPGLIEAAYLEQERVAGTLEAGDAQLLRESLVPLREAQSRNLERGERLEAMLARERAQLENAAGGEAQDPALERLELAAELLPLVMGAMRDAAVALGDSDAPAGRARFGPASQAAGDALTHLDILRRLFASIVEQLREVAQRQLRLQDRTRDAEALAASDADQAVPEIARLHAQQTTLADRTRGLADVLAEQSSQAAAADDPGAARGADTLRLAAEHVLLAEGAMRESEGSLDGMPVEFEVARERQQLALSELEEALALLSPPQDQPEDDGGQGEQPDPQQEQGADPQQQAAPQQDPGAADPGQLLQGVRDREAQRRRERSRGQIPEDTVEKDW